MAAPFAQTIRSLEADRGYGQAVSLALFSLLLAGWLVWLFAARFPSRLTSETEQIQLGAIITTTFSGSTAEKVRVGQPALVHLDAPPLTEALVLSGQVIDVTPVGEKVRVSVAPDFSRLEEGEVSADILAAFAQPTPGRVEVEIERVSPATLVLRASGLNTETAPVFVNP